jgi:hypothetical protein
LRRTLVVVVLAAFLARIAFGPWWFVAIVLTIYPLIRLYQKLGWLAVDDRGLLALTRPGAAKAEQLASSSSQLS